MLQFSDTTNKNGILQKIERMCKLGDGGITGNPTLLKDVTADVNLALARAWDLIFKASGTWQFDDTNQIDYPIITTNLVTGQRDYTFNTDQQGNLILDIYKVVIKNPAGIYVEIYPIDQQSAEYTQGFWSGINVTGIPSRYDKTANGIFIDCLPNYTATDGLKVFINREGTYFNSTDTTKVPGFAGLFHYYLALYASYEYAKTNSLAIAGGRLRNGAFTGLLMELNDMESAIQKFYRDRSRDEVPMITSRTINSI